MPPPTHFLSYVAITRDNGSQMTIFLSMIYYYYCSTAFVIYCKKRELNVEGGNKLRQTEMHLSTNVMIVAIDWIETMSNSVTWFNTRGREKRNTIDSVNPKIHTEFSTFPRKKNNCFIVKLLVV